MGVIATIAGWMGYEIRSLENPRRPLDPWQHALGDSIEGMLSTSGIKVSRDKALTVPAFLRGVSLISRTIAKLPLGVFRHVKPGRESDPDHRAHWLLARQPNEAMTPFSWKQLVAAHAVVEGNHYSYIARDQSNRPVELLPLDPSRTYPVRENKKLWFIHELSGGEKRKLPCEDVLHVKGLSFDGLEGQRLLARARDCLGAALASQAFAGAFYRNSARPNVALKYPGRLAPEARKNLRESWERIHQGLDNAHRVAILEEGLDVVELSINAHDAQMIESKQFSLIEVANLLNLPPHKLGANISTSYKSLEEENQAYLDDAIDPWLVAIEEECEAKLLTNFQRDRDTHTICFDRFPLLRADLNERGSFYTSALQQGWMNWDEIRAREGLNPLPNGLGAVHYRPVGTVAVGGDPDGPGGPAVAPGMDLAALSRAFAAGHPVLCPVQSDAPSGTQGGHWVVVTGTGLGLVFLQDPVRGPVMISEESFLARWHDTDASGGKYARYGIVVAGEAITSTVAGVGAGVGAGGNVSVSRAGEVQDTALNGAQISSLLEILTQQSQGAIDASTAQAVIAAAFPSVAQELAERITAGVRVTPATLPAPAAAVASAPTDSRQLVAIRAVLLDAVRRVVVRIGHQARRAAKEPSGFLRSIDEIVADVVTRAMLAPALAAYSAMTGRDVGEARVARAVCDGLLEVAGRASAASLAGEVDTYMTGIEADPAQIGVVREVMS